MVKLMTMLCLIRFTFTVLHHHAAVAHMNRNETFDTN